MVAAESAVVVSTIFKVLGGTIGAVFTVLFGWMFKKSINTYTKDETEKMIDLKVMPLVESIDRSTEVAKAQTITLEKLTDTLQDLHTSVVVIETKIENIENK